MTYGKRFADVRVWRANLRRLVCAAFTGAFFASFPATGPSGAADATQPELSPAERKALLGALSGTEEGLADLDRLLTQGKAGSKEVEARAENLLQQLKAGGFIQDATAALTVADRIIQASISHSGGGAKIIQFDPSSNFLPSKDVIALDFGPSDKKVSPGFERITTLDKRIEPAEKDGLQAIRRPGQDTLQSGGMIGIGNLKVELTKSGRWRIILMTEALGEGGAAAPFGEFIMVNGVNIPIAQALPEDWVRVARLKTGGESAAEIFNPSQAGPTARFAGGIIVLEVDVPGSELKIGFSSGKTYLTGAIFEPTDKPSVLNLPPEAKDAVFSDKRRLQVEANVSSKVAELVAELVTKAKDSEKKKSLDLPEPVLKNERIASPS
ncbi:MAG: hypothetical protein AB1781_05975 [Pseudomonadota bacterium]